MRSTRCSRRISRARNPAPGGDPAYADPPPTTAAAADRNDHRRSLDDKGVSWAWYAGAWQDALDGERREAVRSFQFHHQPFNYFANSRAGHRGARRAFERCRPRAARTSSRRSTPATAASHVLQAAGQSQRACRAMPMCMSGEQHSPMSSRIWRRARNGRTCWSSSPMMKMAASGIMSRRRRATASARVRGFRQ